MKKAFTLIELFVVIAIIGILFAILIPVFQQARTAAKKSQSKTLTSDFQGCVNPKVVDTTAISNGTLSRIIYLYQCADGRQISSETPPQNLPRKLFTTNK